MALALALCAVILHAIVFNSWLWRLIALLHSFVLERCCSKGLLKAETVEDISKVLMATMAIGCSIVAFEIRPLIPLCDFNFEYFLEFVTFENGVLGVLTSTFASIMYYGFKLFTCALLSIVGYSFMNINRIQLITRAYNKKWKLHTTCPICQESAEASQNAVCCVQNHPFHRVCLNSLIEHQCKKVLAVPSESSQISCPICKSVFKQNQLRKEGGGASKKVLELLNKVDAADDALRKLDPEEQVKIGNKDCYMCPKCNFGPVAHTACADLSAHDGHRGISNKCPKCSFFADKISKWKKWNGGQASEIVPLKQTITSNEALVMEFCAVTWETARDMLRLESNVQRAIANFAQSAPTAHVVSPLRGPQETSKAHCSQSLHRRQ